MKAVTSKTKKPPEPDAASVAMLVEFLNDRDQAELEHLAKTGAPATRTAARQVLAERRKAREALPHG